jgi:predicted MPP superfamily phosphohydrolase
MWGDFVSPEFVSDAVGIMNSLHPDMVVLPGDFFQDTPAQAEACADALSDLIANLGVFACPGNHDHHLDLRKTSVPLGRAGVDLLVNESRSIAYGAASLRLGGLDSVTEGLADHYRALRSVPEDEMAFVLVHEPDHADFLAQSSGHHLPLQISGHSHGGQVRLPFLGAPILPMLAHRYPRACVAWRAPIARCSLPRRGRERARARELPARSRPADPARRPRGLIPAPGRP